MALEKTQQPYEFLARWDEQGKLSGAHVKFRTIVTDDGSVLSRVDGDALPVDIGVGQGFPLTDILSQLHIDAVAQAATAAAQAEEAKAASAASAQQAANMKAKADAAVTALDSALTALTAVKTQTGVAA